jgi:hypothetical protein
MLQQSRRSKTQSEIDESRRRRELMEEKNRNR